MPKDTKENLVNALLEYFKMELENLDYDLSKIIKLPYMQKRYILQGVINTILHEFIPENILELEDRLLQMELKEKTITNYRDLEPIMILDSKTDSKGINTESSMKNNSILKFNNAKNTTKSSLDSTQNLSQNIESKSRIYLWQGDIT